MQTKRLAAAALSLTLLLSACGGDPAPAGGSAQPSVPAQESQTGGQSEEHTVSYDYRDYEDRHCGFKLKTPILQRENKAGTGYYIQRGGGDDDWAIVMINHYNEKQDGDAYNTTQFDTAEHALAELQQSKVDSMLHYLMGNYVMDSSYTTADCEINGLEAVRYEGTYTIGRDKEEPEEWHDVGVVGYCILGSQTPVLLTVVDLSDGQDKLEELADIMDEMAYTYEDGPAE